MHTGGHRIRLVFRRLRYRQLALVEQLSTARLSRHLRRLRAIGVIKRVECDRSVLPRDREYSHSGFGLIGFLMHKVSQVG
jgi:hypothetical protein